MLKFLTKILGNKGNLRDLHNKTKSAVKVAGTEQIGFVDLGPGKESMVPTDP